VALELGKQLVRAGRERDEPGNGPPAVGLTTEYVHALFRRLVLGAIHLCREGPGQSNDRNIANDHNLVNVGIVVVELESDLAGIFARFAQIVSRVPISRQAAARVARYANRPPLTDDELRQAIRELERQERLLGLRPFKLALKVLVGALIFAGIMFYPLGADLRLAFPTASAPQDTRR
jgi:hypothetical protein